MTTNNPFEIIFDKLEKIERSQIIIANRLSEKEEEERKEQENKNAFLTLPDVARILQKPVGTVRSYIHSRGLPAKRMGKGYLIYRNDLEKWLGEWMKQEKTCEENSAYSNMLEIRKRYRKS